MLIALFLLLLLLSPGPILAARVHRALSQSELRARFADAQLRDYEVHDLSELVHLVRRRLEGGREALELPIEALGQSVRLVLNKVKPREEYKAVIVGADGIHREDPLPDCIYTGGLQEDDLAQAVVSLCDDYLHISVVNGRQVPDFTLEPLGKKSGGEHVAYRHLDVIVAKDCLAIDSTPGNLRLRRADHVGGRHHGSRDFHHNTDRAAQRTLFSSQANVGVVYVNDVASYIQYGQYVQVHTYLLYLITVAAYHNLTEITTGYMDYYGKTPPPVVISIKAQYTFTSSDPWINALAYNEVNATQLLAHFDAWRATNIKPPVTSNDATTGYSVAQLLSGVLFLYPIIGLAYLDNVCNTLRSSIVQATNLPFSAQALTMAHELGHNLGMWHDNYAAPGFGSLAGTATCDQTQPNSIMAAQINPALATGRWSQCSVAWFDAWYFYLVTNGYGSGTLCLDQANHNTDWNASKPVCGDGIVQAPEQCDCLNQDCSSDPCCNPDCTFTSGSQCQSADPCCSSCQIVTDTSHVCRPSAGFCDVAESCDGTRGSCPPDLGKTTGTACTTVKNGTAGTCYGTSCVSIAQQCIDQEPAWVNGPCAGHDSNSGNCRQLWCLSASHVCQSTNPAFQIIPGAQCLPGYGCSTSGQCLPFSSLSVYTGDWSSPTQHPTARPSKSPVSHPSRSPTPPTTWRPSKSPTQSPTKRPTPPTQSPHYTRPPASGAAIVEPVACWALVAVAATAIWN